LPESESATGESVSTTRESESAKTQKRCEHPPRIVDSGIQKILLPKTNANGQALLRSKRLSVMRTFTLRITLRSTPSTIFEEPRHSFVGLEGYKHTSKKDFVGGGPTQYHWFCYRADVDYFLLQNYWTRIVDLVIDSFVFCSEI
jgi:hypothetical protein